MFKKSLLIITILFFSFSCSVNHERTISNHTNLINISDGWAANSINTVVFRHNSLASYMGVQYAAFYAADSSVILAKRNTGSQEWDIKKTGYKGNIADAHNCISIIVDGSGYLHMAWDHHGSTLNYCKSVSPGSLDLSNKLEMTGVNEENVTYPEFYMLPDGNLIFLYRDGSSGNGNLVMNYYDNKNQKWSKQQDNLISGEGERNAYWQAAVSNDGVIHLSWVWRETWDVSTNHDVCYAKSTDNGKTWEKSTGEKYTLPITVETAEYAAKIPQGNELINQTSMCTDAEGNPYIATYMTAEKDSIPQYYVIYNNDSVWKMSKVTNRNLAFSLNGGGTKRIPISRPQIMIDSEKYIYLIYRDEERGSKVTAAWCSEINNVEWNYLNLTSFSTDMWEPTYDIDMWKDKNVLNLFIQKVGQGDGETLEDTTSTMISVLEWEPLKDDR